MKKLIALALCLVMLLPLAVSCKKDSGVSSGDSTDIAEIDTGNETVELVKEQYRDFNYNGYGFRILAISPGEHYQAFIAEDSTEIWYADDSADALQHAVFTRNLLTEDLLNVTITPQWGGNTYEVTDLTTTLIKSGSDDFDMVHNSQFKTLPQAMEKYFYNLYSIENFDVNADWWDQEYVDTFTYRKNQVYTIVGDYLTLDDYSTSVLFYNKNVIDNYNLDDPADYVDAGTWTIDAMMDMAAKVTNDISGDGKMDENDSWGLLDNGFDLIHFIEGCDCHVTALDDDGVPQVVIDQEQFINTVQFVYEKVSSSKSVLNLPNDDDLIIIKDDRALFYHEVLGAIYNFRDMEGDFSMLPIPKMNETQKEYTSIGDGIWCTVLAMPINVKDTAKAGAIMNVLGGMSTDTVDKALYEIVLGPKLFREKRTVDMLKYCLEARDFDWAKDINWGYPIYNAITDQARSETFAFASKLAASIKSIKAQLKGFVKRLPKN